MCNILKLSVLKEYPPPPREIDAANVAQSESALSRAIRVGRSESRKSLITTSLGFDPLGAISIRLSLEVGQP